jgi:hypothetical protein
MSDPCILYSNRGAVLTITIDGMPYTPDELRALIAGAARERVAVEAYERQQSAQREWEAVYQAITERARQAEAERDEARADAAALNTACRAAALWIGALDVSYWDDSPLGDLNNLLGQPALGAAFLDEIRVQLHAAIDKVLAGD